jgi:hypothetical protein
LAELEKGARLALPRAMTTAPRSALLAALFPAAVLFSCGPEGMPAAEGDDELGESSVALTLAPGSAEQILAVVNYPGTDATALDVLAGLDVRAAKNIITRRNGTDGVTPSADDALFGTIAELDAVSYVGDVAFQKLLAYARSHPAPAGEVVEGVSFRGWESEAVVWGVNNAPAATLDGMLDARAAKSLVTARPFKSVTQMGPLGYVGPSALERLRREAGAWWKARTVPAQPTQPATLDQVKAALLGATTDLLMPSETDAKFVWVQGQQLNGADITITVVRSQLTAQHDALIETVMYTDPSDRSLAAKSQVETIDAAAFFDHIIGGVDPNDPYSIAMGEKFKTLKAVTFQNLTDVKVYRFGRISISTFIVGRAPTGELVGLLTGQVET